MIVVFVEEAETDLERIGDHIARDNPDRAESFVQELIAKCNELIDMPLAFPVAGRFARNEIRRRVHRDYLIFHRARSDFIEILHVLHGAQDYEAMLFPKH